jgi:hypothetical protein
MQKIVCFIGVLALIAGCSAEPGTEKAETGDNRETTENIGEVIATEKTFPANFRKIGFQREESPDYTYLIKQATEQEQYEELWSYFRLQEEAPEVDMDVKSVMFFSLEESSTCPFELRGEDIQLNPTTKMLEVEIFPTNSEEEECTLDAAPRTFVIEVTKEAAPLENALIYEHEIETTVPIN